MTKVLTALATLIGAATLAAAPAAANMCGPGRGPLGYFWPAIEVCQAPVPGAGGMFNVPMPAPPQTVPYPGQVPTPGYPFATPPLGAP